MEKRKSVIIGVIMLVLIIACAISNFVLLAQSAKLMPKIGTVLNFVAMTCTAIYCIKGYRKKDSIFYKGFFLFYALHILTGIYGMVVDFKGSPMAAAWMIAFTVTYGNLLMLFIPDNFGIKKSTIVTAINDAIWIGFLLHHFIFKSHTVGLYTIRIISYLLSAIITSILIYAKYADKKGRKGNDSVL